MFNKKGCKNKNKPNKQNFKKYLRFYYIIPIKKEKETKTQKERKESMKLKKGMKVKIHENPLSGIGFEGKAILKRFWKEDKVIWEGEEIIFEYWYVQFHIEEGEVLRKIRIN